MQLKDKIVVITGASSGIGALTAQMLSKRGAVPILLARSEDKLKETAAGIPGVFGLYTCDVRDEAEVERTFGEILAVYGRIDILLNNAGYGKFAGFTEMEPHEFDDMMDVNYMGIVRCTKAVVPHMLQREAGRLSMWPPWPARLVQPVLLLIQQPNMRFSVSRMRFARNSGRAGLSFRR